MKHIKPKQKFFRGHRVRIADNLGPTMSHFASGRDAIVVGSFSDLLTCSSGEGEVQYELLLEEDDAIGTVAWYKESQLTLVDGDRDKGENLLQLYKKPFSL